MKNLKKIIGKAAAAALAAALVTMSSVSVFAQTGVDTIDTTKSVSLTIYKYDMTAAEAAEVDVDSFTADGERDAGAETALAKYALKGVQFTYVKVGDINTNSASGTVEILYDVPDELIEDLGMTVTGDHLYTSDALNAALTSSLTDSTATRNTLETWIKKQGTKGTLTTDANGYATVSGLTQGLYLVVETEVPEEVHTTTNPFFVSLPMTDKTGEYWNYDVYVYPKNQTNNPTIDKLVSENGTYADIATASEGDTLAYRIVSKLPHITSQATYLTTYTFVDTASDGLKYNNDTYIAFYENEADARNATGTPYATWEKGSSYFNADYSGNTMTVTMTDSGLAQINPDLTDKYMVVIYTATVQSSASTVLGDTGNPNDVALTYIRTNTAESSTIKDEANVYTYGLNIKKTFEDGAGDATKVQFKLRNSTQDYYVTATGSNGVYYVTDGTHGATEADGTTFSPASDGTLQINGLEADTYILTEIATDDGYSLLKEELTIAVSQTMDTITPSTATMTGFENPNEEVIVTPGDRASATVDGEVAQMSADNSSTDARVDMGIVNTQTFVLPMTGGTGIMVIPMIGAAAIIFGVAYATKRKKNA